MSLTAIDRNDERAYDVTYMAAHTQMDLAYAAQVFKGLSDEKRLAILSLLGQGEQCVCELTQRLGMAQSALSYHMKVLLQAGIVCARQNGKWSHYSIDPEAGERLMRLLTELTTARLAEDAASVEACCD